MWIDTVMLKFGYAKMPKPQPGMNVCGPVLRKNPVRKPKETETVKIPGPLPGAMELPGMPEPIKLLNLCDTCTATARDCLKAVKETDGSNNTVRCDQCLST